MIYCDFTEAQFCWALMALRPRCAVLRWVLYSVYILVKNPNPSSLSKMLSRIRFGQKILAFFLKSVFKKLSCTDTV